MTHDVADRLPDWRGVLAVVAHPDDESFGLGAVLTTFAAGGAAVSLLCLTHGEASTLREVDGDLSEIRERELTDAADVLGIVRVGLDAFPDGGLADVPMRALVAEIGAFAELSDIDGVVVFDPSGITGHPDHQMATEAALEFGRSASLPVLAWTLPADVAKQLTVEYGVPFAGHEPAKIDLVIGVDRAGQQEAALCHPSQVTPGAVLWRRLELLGPYEHLRWLLRP